MQTKHAVTPTARQTKYTIAVHEALRVLKHATNDQILGIVRQIYPEVSFTTIYRATARLKSREVIASAPKTTTAEERFDIDPTPHHHFMCMNCERLCDVVENEQSRAAVDLLGIMSKQCKFAGMVTLQGTCGDCAEQVKSLPQCALTAAGTATVHRGDA